MINAFLQLKCLAKIHDIYEELAERSVEEDSTNNNVMETGTSVQNMKSYSSFENSQNGELSSDGPYLTHQTISKCFFFKISFFLVTTAD